MPLPYPTDRRRLLMMVRSFVHGFEDFIGTHWHGSKYPSDPNDQSADFVLEEHLEQLALEADETDDDVSEMFGEPESEDEVMRSFQEHIDSLLRRASWNEDRISAN